MSNPKWLDSALKDIGETEIKGSEHNPKIVDYHRTTGGPAPDEIPWCSSFCNFHMNRGAQICGTGSRLARSWLSWGRVLIDPIPGAIVILRRGSEPWMGHVGFFIKESPSRKSIAVLGGNQGDRVSIDWFSKTKVLGYRWPTTLEGFIDTD